MLTALPHMPIVLTDPGSATHDGFICWLSDLSFWRNAVWEFQLRTRWFILGWFWNVVVRENTAVQHHILYIPQHCDQASFFRPAQVAGIRWLEKGIFKFVDYRVMLLRPRVWYCTVQSV